MPHLAHVLALEPDHVLAHFHLARCLRSLGRLEEARGLLTQAMSLQPGFAPPYFLMAEWDEASRGVAAARAALEEGLRALPMHEPLHAALLQLDLRHHLLAQAATDAWAALRVLPKGGEGHWHALVASFLFQEGHPDQGRMLLGMGLASFPRHPLLQRLRDLEG